MLQNGTLQKLTTREKRFIKNLAAGMTQIDAALEAGYSPRSVRNIACQTYHKPKIQSAILKAMEKQGITDNKLAEVMRKGLDANKVISANVISEDGEGMKDANSMTKDFVEVPDWLARHKFTDTALKLKGAYPTEKMEVSGNLDIRSIQIVFQNGTVVE